MLSVKQGGIKYNFLSLCYDSTWTIGEHSTHLTNGLFKWYTYTQIVGIVGFLALVRVINLEERKFYI